jgi:hypothetical protein
MKKKSKRKDESQLAVKTEDDNVRRWRKRLTIVTVAILALALISRLVIFVALPPVLRKVAAHYGLNANYERMELYLLNGDVGIWHFSLTPQEGGNPLVQADYSRLHISTFDLLLGKLTVLRLESEGIDLLAERTADGKIPLLDRLEKWKSEGAAAPLKAAASNDAPGSPQRIDLTSPLQVDAFRLTSVHTHIVDSFVSPPVDMRVDLNLRLTDVDSTVRPTHFEMDLTASPLLDLLHVEGTGTAAGAALDAVVHVRANGIHPQPGIGYLLPMGVRPTSGDIDMEMDARIDTLPVPGIPSAIAAKLALSNVSVSADSTEVARLDKLNANIDAIDFSMAAINHVEIAGGRCRLLRDARGEIGLAGMQVMQPAILQKRLAVPLTALINAIPEHWGIGELVLRDMEASLHDESLAGGAAADLTGRLDEMRIINFSADHPDTPTTFRGRVSAPGIVRSVRLDGQMRPHADKKDIDLTIGAEGIKLDALKPYLDRMGIASDYSDGTINAKFHADLTPGPGGELVTNARLSDVVVKDRDENLAMNEVAINEAQWNPARGMLHVKSLEMSGPSVKARRQADGTLAAFGFHTQGHPASAGTASSGTDGAASPKQVVQYIFVLPKIQVDQFRWKDVHLQFDDLAVTPPVSIRTADGGVEIDNCIVDFDPVDQPVAPARVRAWLAAPNLAESLVSQGTFLPKPFGLAADLAMDGKGITAQGLAGYFQNSRLVPTLHDGSLHLATSVVVGIQPGVVRADLSVNDLAFKQGPDDLLAAGGVDITGVTARIDGVSVDRIALQAPKIAVSREADGSLHFAGLKLVPVPKQTQTGDRLAQIYQDRANDSATSGTSVKRPVEFTAALKELDVTDASLQWNDRAVSPEASAHLTASTNVRDLVLGESSQPAKVRLSMHEDHDLDSLAIAGTVTPSLSAPAAQVQIDASGIRPGTLASYVPAGLVVNLQNGKFSAAVDASTTLNPAGGVGARLLVEKLDYRDGDTSLCQLDALRLYASRIDPAGKVYAIDEVGVDGLQTSAALDKTGAARLLGLTLAITPAVKTSHIAQPVVVAPAADAKAVGIANLAALANQKHPFISLAKLDIGVRSLSLSDESRPDAAPLTLADANLTNARPIALLGENPQSHPPVDLALSGVVNPLVQSVKLHLIAMPFDEQATANIDVDLAGIRGAGVTELIPEFKPWLDGTSLTDGQFKAQLHVQIRQPRSDPLDLDLSRDFAADVTLKNVEFRDGAGGVVLAGVGEVTSDDIRVEPARLTVSGRDLLVNNLTASAYRDEAGIHVLGCTLKPALWKKPPGLSGSAAASTGASATTQASGSAEISLGKFVADGLTVNFQDRMCDPPLIVPLSGMDLEARDLSTRMFSEDKSCRFNLIINAGKVTLPRRNPARGEPMTEDRDLFSQVEAGGIISLYPQPKGWIKSSVSSLDLAALSGEAKRLGFTLSGGTFDGSSDLRLNGDGTMRARAKFSLTDLDVSEPPNGPVTQFLRINTPLNIAVAAVQDQDGSITIPVDVPIEAGRISGPDLTLAVTGAVASVVATAITSAPLKSADAVLSLFGNEKQPKDDQPVTLVFAPGDRSIGSGGQAALAGLLTRMKADPTLEVTVHQTLGAGDVARAAVLANPTPEDCGNLAYQLRLKKIELLEARQAASQRAEAQLASGYGADADAAVGQLREIDDAIAVTETALDQVYDMMRPGAERQAPRRTRAACLQIAQDRIEGVREALVAGAIPGIGSRVKTTHASYNVAGTDAGNGGGMVTITLSHKKIQ